MHKNSAYNQTEGNDLDSIVIYMCYLYACVLITYLVLKDLYVVIVDIGISKPQVNT